MWIFFFFSSDGNCASLMSHQRDVMSDCSTPGGDGREAYQHAKDSSSPNLERGDLALWEGHTLKVQPRAQSAFRAAHTLAFSRC